MKKVWLRPGMRISLTGGTAMVGLSCSLADVQVEWGSVEDGNYKQMGDFVDDEGWSHPVYRDCNTGKLFYDDDVGH